MDFKIVKKEAKILDVEPIKQVKNELGFKTFTRQEEGQKKGEKPAKKRNLNLEKNIQNLSAFLNFSKLFTNKLKPKNTFKIREKTKLSEFAKNFQGWGAKSKTDFPENINPNFQANFSKEKQNKLHFLHKIFNNFFTKLLIFTIIFAGVAFYSFNLGRKISDTHNWKNKFSESEKKRLETQAKLTHLEAVNIKNETRLKDLDKKTAQNAAPSALNYTMSLAGGFKIKDFPTFSINLGPDWSVSVTDESGAIIPATISGDTENNSQTQNIQRNISFTKKSGSNLTVILENKKPVLNGVKCWGESGVLDIEKGWFRTYDGGEDRFYSREDKTSSGYGLILPATDKNCKNSKQNFAQGHPFAVLSDGAVATIKANYKSEADKNDIDNIVKNIKI